MKKSISIILAILMCFSCFSIISFAETTDSEHITTVPDGYVGIYTKDDLDNIKLDLSGKYILMNDIVFTEEDYAEGGSFYNSGKGWSPIGTEDYPFKGIFNGNKYNIVNLQINNPNENYQGLFGYATNATITKVILIASNIIGKTYVGGLIGYSKYCLVTDCINTATVTGQDEVAGIAGYDFYSAKADNYGFYRCINTGNITATNGGAAGIIGYCYRNYNSRTNVSYCFNAGNIKSSISSYGIASNAANIIQSYSIGNIKGANSYPNYPIGYADNTIKFCYYLDTSITTLPYGGGIAKSEDQMAKQTTYEGWDFDTVWTMEGREDYPYPELRNVSLVFPDELTHKHEYSSEITTPATHLTEGVETFTCACGDTYTEAIAKTTEHTYNAVVTAPTCTEKGYTTYTCECGDSYVADYVDATGHSHIATVTTPATHLTEGVVTYACSCGDTYTEIIEKTAQHTFKESIMYHPSCTEEGTKLFSCECGESYTEAIPKTKHIDENDDHSCDICGKGVCSHLCHKSGFMGFIWKIVQFFWKLFGMNPICECGAQHY